MQQLIFFIHQLSLVLPEILIFLLLYYENRCIQFEQSLIMSPSIINDFVLILIRVEIMRNREIIEYLVYPKFFNSISILYKGNYCVSFKIYHITRNKTITYAYPFLTIIPNIEVYEEYALPSVHADGNFSYQTELRYALYEQEKKILNSFCVFRLQYQMGKQYETFMSCKLLRKITSHNKDENQFCVKKQAIIKYETIDTQIYKFKNRVVSVYDKIVFRASEFFSSIDLFITTFNYGYKYFTNKLQISNLLLGADLSKAKPTEIFKLKQSSNSEKYIKRNQRQLFMNNQFKDIAVTVTTNYYQLLAMILQYDKWFKQIHSLKISLKSENFGKQSMFESEEDNLNYIRMTKPVAEANLNMHYQSSRIEDTLICILEEKEMIRKNIRNLRVVFSQLMLQQSQKQFREFVEKNMAKKQALIEKYFVRHLQELSKEQQNDSQLRNEAVSNYIKNIDLLNEKIIRTPILLIENYDKKIREGYKTYSLTIFVHGYQGNSFDFQKARNYLKKNNKHTHILIIESISNEMNSSIGDLGFSAAEQITIFLQNSVVKYQAINFIGFSLGGVIARSAFKHLDRYKHLFGIFITFSSPHLGISQSENSLVNIGVWYLIKVDKVINLKELNFQSVKMHESLLMKLSKCQNLMYFKKIVLVGSKNDGFVPLYSTILEEGICDVQIKVLCQNMKKNMSKLQRHSGTLDKLTGRKGHIEFLDNDYFLEIFFKLYACQL